MTTPLERTVRTERLAGVAGDLADVGHSDKKTFLNSFPQAKQQDTLTVDANVLGQQYTVTIDEVDITSEGTSAADTTEAAEKIRDAINDEPLVNGRVVATSAANVVTVTARIEGLGYSISETEADLTLASVTANAEADPVPFGRVVVSDTFGDGQNKLARLPDSANMTVESLELTYNAGTVQTLWTLDGDETVLEAEGGTAAALATAIDNLAGLSAAEAGGVITVTPENTGQGFRLESLDGDADVTDQTLGQELDEIAVGVTIRVHTEEIDDVGGDEAQYGPNANMSVLSEGRIYVDVESDVVGPNDPVFVRVAANGDLDKIGGFARASGVGLVRWNKAKWVRKTSTDKLAVLEVNV